MIAAVRIVVFADDLTGAAEIGGIATRFGLRTRLLRTPAPPPADAACVVYDTDTRLLPRDQAVATTRQFAKAAAGESFGLIFKKTDSALRGEPLAEVVTVTAAVGRDDVLFVPHNPSRGRCVTGGTYRVHGMPLHETEFARDPTHPATTSDVLGLLRLGDVAVRCVPAGGRPIAGMTVGEAASATDVAGWADRFDSSRHVAAGGADFFEALCRRLSPAPSAAVSPPALPRPLLFVSGTASPATADFRELLGRRGAVLAMPNDLFERDVSYGVESDRWAGDAVGLLGSVGVAMLTIGRPTDPTPGKAARLGITLAETAARVLRSGSVAAVACEGGATAAVLCDTLGWRQFDVEGELSPGVVVLRAGPAGVRLAVKPGSYAWPMNAFD